MRNPISLWVGLCNSGGPQPLRHFQAGSHKPGLAHAIDRRTAWRNCVTSLIISRCCSFSNQPSLVRRAMSCTKAVFTKGANEGPLFAR
eukprot:scaffold738_cov349-Prasinococcus_capsulatus_cf.AAC.2